MVHYKLIVGNPGYRVGDDGSIWSEWRKRGLGQGNGTTHYRSGWWIELKPHLTPSGSLQIALGREVKKVVARLVLQAFVGPCPEGMEVCHFPDRDGSNCRLDNLRWDTSQSNTEDQRKHGTLIGGQRHGMAKLTNEQIDELRLLAGTMTQRKLGARFGIKQPHVSDILNGKKRTASSHAGKGI